MLFKRQTSNEYENFVMAHIEAATECIPSKLRTKCRVPQDSMAVREKRDSMKKAPFHKRNPINANEQKFKNKENKHIPK